jgi:hypothetical protein
MRVLVRWYHAEMLPNRNCTFVSGLDGPLLPLRAGAMRAAAPGAARYSPEALAALYP